MASTGRPLSPHLQIYRWQWTMALSILHRATGIALIAGSVLLVAWLVTLAGGPDSYLMLRNFLTSLPGYIMLIGWTWSLFYHLANGIRHLVWDAGLGYDLPVARASGYAVFAVSVILTVGFWGVIYRLVF